jgi:hypothetical protein
MSDFYIREKLPKMGIYYTHFYRSDSNKTDTNATEQKARPDINNTLALERRGLIEVTQRFDKDLFTPEEWNLKSVLAVQVYPNWMFKI